MKISLSLMRRLHLNVLEVLNVHMWTKIILKSTFLEGFFFQAWKINFREIKCNFLNPFLILIYFI